MKHGTLRNFCHWINQNKGILKYILPYNKGFCWAPKNQRQKSSYKSELVLIQTLKIVFTFDEKEIKNKLA